MHFPHRLHTNDYAQPGATHPSQKRLSQHASCLEQQLAKDSLRKEASARFYEGDASSDRHFARFRGDATDRISIPANNKSP